MLEKVVSFDTTSRNSNLPLIHFIEDYLAQYSIDSSLTYDDNQEKANLFARIGPDLPNGIILSGHSDVVPVDGQDWDSHPFTLTERAGKLFGRGTCDMKGFMAVALAMVPEFASADLSRPVYLAFSYDEELGCIGVRRLIDDLKQRGVTPQMCIVGEPSEMGVITAHKGKHSYHVSVRGMECHSSLKPHGVNAVEAAADAIHYLNRMGRRCRDEGPHDDRFDVRYTTVHTGVVQGGTAINIVPLDCEFEFEFRHLPCEAPDELFAEFEAHVRTIIEPPMKAIDPSTGFTIERLTEFPGLNIEEEDSAVEVLKQLAQTNSVERVVFGTEAGLFQRAGISTIVCGPGCIDQAHKPNEFVTVEQVSKCYAFMQRLKRYLSSNG